MNPDITNSNPQILNYLPIDRRPGSSLQFRPNHLVSVLNDAPPHFNISHFPTAVQHMNVHNENQKMPVNVGITSAPDFQTVLSCPNKIVSSTTQSRQPPPPPEPTFIIGPVYSLAGGSELQRTNSSQSGNPSEQAPVISYGQTMYSGYGTQQTNVSAILLSEKPQICIGSVFTLADNPVTQDCTNSTVTSQEREHPPSHKVKNITIQSVQSLSQMSPPPNTSYFISTQSSNSTTATLKVTSPVIAKHASLTHILNEPLLSQLPLSSVNTGRSHILSTSNPERVLHKPPKPCSWNIPLNINIYDSPTVTSTVPALVASSSLKTTSNTQPILSHKHTNPIKGTAEIRCNEMLKTDDAHREHISIQNSNSTSNLQPHAVSVPEVVDLDTEDIDDCLLVKVDFSRIGYPFGNNIEVVIDDSDTDEDITNVTDKDGDKQLKDQSVVCETASEKIDSSTVSVNLNNTVEDNSLNMEVEEINNETESSFPKHCEQSTLDETLNTAVDTDPKVAVSSNSETDIHIASNVQNSEISSSSWHIVDASATWDDDSAGEFELLELHVDDETPPAENIGRSSLKLITPSKFSPKQNISPIKVPESVHIVSFHCSSSLLNKNSVASVLQTGGQIPCFESALQDQGNTNVLGNQEVSTLHPDGNYTQCPALNVSKENIIISSSKQLSKKVPNILKRATQTKTPRKTLSCEAAADSRATTKEQFLISETAKNQQFSEQINMIEPNNILSILTKFAQKSSVMCKICFSPLYSWSELVTHTWNCHRQLQPLSNKCENAFKPESALKLHKKRMCTAILGKESQPKQVNGVIDSVLGNQLSANSTRMRKADTFVTLSSADHPNQKSKSRMVVTKEAVVDLAVSDHKQLKKTGSTCSNDVNLLRSESCEASASEYLLPDKQSLTAKSPMNVAQSECQMTMIKSEIDNFHDPVTTGIVSSIDTPSSSGLDQHQQESGHEILNKVIHECSNCQTKFVNQLQHQEHQLNSDCFKISKSYICFVCKEKFAESPLRYMHMWTNPQCKEGINRYCFMCSKIFKDASKKQAHFNLSRACCFYDIQLMTDFVKSSDENITENIDKSGVEIEEDCQASTMCDITDPPSSKADADLTQPSCEISLAVDKVQDSIHCKLCTNEFRSHATLSLHLQMSPACKSYTDTLCKQQENNNAAQNLQTEEMSNIKCTAVKKRFATNSIPTYHLMESRKCRMRALQPFKVNKKHPLIGKKKKICVQPKDCTVQQFELKESNVSNCKGFTISLEPSSVMCKNCHSPFTDDLKLAEHIRLSYSCRKMYPERTNKNVELKKLLLSNVTGTKDGKKNWSCLIASGISDNTSIISMNSTNEDQIPWTEQTAEVDGNLPVRPLSVSTDVPSVITPDNQVLNISSAKQVCVRDEVCISDREKDLMQSLLSSDSESDTEETEDSISESDACEYKCRHCSETFTCRSAYIKHTKLHHSSSQNRSIHCKVCTRKFHDLTGLQAHLLQFRFCFIPLTRTLWERTQDPQSCSMCKKILHSPKDLRKHCFKNMACRLRYINAVLQNQKGKDTFNRSVLTETPKTPLLPPNEIKISVSKTKENCSESKKGANKVSLVRDNECPQDYIPLINVAHDNGCTDKTKDAPSPSSKCLHCGKTYNNITEHLFNHQACLNFYGRHTNEHPVQLPFCYKCKQIFDNIVTPTNHICKSKVTFTHACQKCGLKFNNEKDFNVHIYDNTACSKAAPDFVQVRKHRKKTDLHNVKQNGGQLLPAAKVAASTIVSKDITSVEQQFPCMICNAKYPTLRLLMEHSSHHVEETPIKCDRCNMTFVHYNRFVSHQAFHMRMDKEVSICPEQVQNNVLPSVVKKSQSPESSKSNDADITKTHNKQGAKNILICLFCHQEFSTRAAKRTHLSNSPSCRGAMTYILDNRFFVKDSESQESCADTNSCDFCHQKISNQISHYLQSACLYKLEDAIFRFRSSISSTGSEKATPILPDSNSKTTICDDFLVPTLQNIPCPICKQSFDNHNLLANHHREKHAYTDVGKLPRQDYMNDKFDEHEAIYCFKCNKFLRTEVEARVHRSTCSHQHLLPCSAVGNAEWDPQNYMCRICDRNLMYKHSLIRHMLRKHCNDTNILLVAAGHRTALCSICNKKVLVRMKNAHFKKHRDAYVKAAKENSLLDITAHSERVCIFCGSEYSSVKRLFTHVNMHKFSDTFIKQKDALKQKISYRNVQPKVRNHQQTLKGSIHNSSDLGLVAVGSKINDKKVSCEQPFKLSLETSHLQFPSKKCKAYTKPIKHRPDIDTGECSSSTPLTGTTKDNTSTPPRKSNTAKMKNSKDVDMFRDVKSHSAKQKTAELNPIGSCKLCHKKFLNLTAFKFHFKTKHKNYDPNDHKRLFQHILLKQGDDIDNNSAVKNNKGCSSKDLNHHLGKVDVDIAASSSSVSHKSLPRVCLICRASFKKSSKYQAHLRTHITQCKVVLPDCFISQITSTDDCEPVGVDSVKIEVDNTTELDFTINDGSIFEQNTQTNQGETFHSVSTSEGGGFSQCKSINSEYASSSAQHTVDVELLVQNQEITRQENQKFEYIEYGFDFEHSTQNKVIKQENHNVDSRYGSVSGQQVYDFDFSAQNQKVTILENQNFISELQNATCETRIAKPGSCTSIMNGSLTNSTDIFRSVSNASDQRECIIKNVTSLADLWTMLETDRRNNAITALKERQDTSSNENIVRHSRDITGYTQESILTAETSAYQISHYQTEECSKKRVYETSCELNSESKKRKLATSSTLLLDCSRKGDGLSDISEISYGTSIPNLKPANNSQIALSNISETDNDVWIPKLKPAGNSQIALSNTLDDDDDVIWIPKLEPTNNSQNYYSQITSNVIKRESSYRAGAFH